MHTKSRERECCRCGDGDGQPLRRHARCQRQQEDREQRRDFERDRAACTDKKKKTFDEDCMKRRGWVAVTAPKAEEKPTTPQGPAYRPR